MRDVNASTWNTVKSGWGEPNQKRKCMEPSMKGVHASAWNSVKSRWGEPNKKKMHGTINERCTFWPVTVLMSKFTMYCLNVVLSCFVHHFVT